MKGPSKYITIPDYKPLWAMARCFGPLKGPLQKPICIPLDVIYDLICQSGNDKVSVYETIPVGKDKFTDPVLLTKENYHLPYDVITGITEPAPTAKIEETKVEEVIQPKVVQTESEPVVEEREVETVIADEPATEPVVIENSVVEEETTGAAEEKIEDKYAGMTKKQRKEARRAERLAAVQNIVENQNNEAPAEEVNE